MPTIDKGGQSNSPIEIIEATDNQHNVFLCKVNKFKTGNRIILPDIFKQETVFS